MNRTWLNMTVWLILAMVEVSTMAVAQEPTPTSQAQVTTPRKVAVEAYLLDLLRIEGQAQRFKADMAVLLQWHDPELAGRFEKVRIVSGETVGWRGLQVVNDQNVTAKLPDVVEVGPDGTVTYRQRYLGEFSTSMDLRSFPFDHQQLAVRFAVPGKRPEDLVFSCRQGSAGLTSEPTVADWRVDGIECRRADLHLEVFERRLAGFSVTIDVERRTGFYVGKAFVSVAIIVFMSWAVFWLAPKHINPRVGVSVTSMLTLIAYRFLLGQDLPKLGYLTRLDYFLLGATALVFLTLVEVTACSWLETRGRDHAMSQLDRHSRWVFPLAFAMLFVAVFVM